MPGNRYKEVDIELNVYIRGGQWTGEYILIYRAGGQILNEVHSLSETGQTQREARRLAICEARRAIDAYLSASPNLVQRLAPIFRATAVDAALARLDGGNSRGRSWGN